MQTANLPDLEAEINDTVALMDRSIAVKQRLRDNGDARIIATMAFYIADSIKQGGKLLLCGNGGSASDAQHLAAELLVRLRASFDRQPLPAISLACDASTLTACANDYGFAQIFERTLTALGRRGDVLLALSTSGRSENILRALQAARAQSIIAFGFLGDGGGPALDLCDMALVAPSDETGRVQETHIMAGHALLELVERRICA